MDTCAIGNIFNIPQTVETIPDRKYINNEAREICEGFKILFELSTEAVFIHKDGIIILANAAGAELLGAKGPGELSGISIFQFIHGDYHDAVMKRVSDVREGRKCAPLSEERFTRLNGEVIDVEVTAAPFTHKDTTYALTIVKDVTDKKKMEKSLRDSEMLLRKVTENTLDLIGITDKEGIFKYVTPSHKNILGYEPDQLLDGKISRFIHPEDVEYVLSEYEKMLSTLCHIKIVFRYKHNEGHFIWLESVAKPLYDNDGVEGFIFSSRDISDRINGENMLKKSRKKFRDLFNNINDTIFIYRFAEPYEINNFIEVNNAACRRLGYTREEFYSMSPFSIDPTLDTAATADFTMELLRKGSITCETINVTKNGEIIPVEINSILFDMDGEKVILSIARDITERLRNEKSLSESEERYRTLIELLPYAVFIRNDKKVLFTNKMGLKFFNAEAEAEVVNKNISELLSPHPEYAEMFRKNLLYIEENGYLPLSEEKFIRAKDGEEMDIESVAKKIYYKGEEAVLLVSRDIAERKRAQELQRRMEEKTRQLDEAFEYEKLRTEFFANISHELRTPINVILSALQLFNLNLDLMDNGDNIEKTKRHIFVMKQNCYRLIRLINNLIDVTKIDSGYMHLNLNNYNIVSVVEEITLSVAEYIENKGISLTFDTDIEEKLIACDPDKIERVVLNLISNAVKFTEPGGSILVFMQDKDASISISVTDTGIGIPEEKQKYIFERFVQVDKSLARTREGSGIGLSLVKSLIEMHEGSIRVESEQGKGSKFIVDIPAKIIYNAEPVINNNEYDMHGNIEKINVEFSDIYF